MQMCFIFLTLKASTGEFLPRFELGLARGLAVVGCVCKLPEK